MRAAIGLALLAPMTMGMLGQCVAFAPPTTVGSRDAARLTDGPSGAARAGATMATSGMSAASVDIGYRVGLADGVEVDGAAYGAAFGSARFGAARAGLRFRLIETGRAAVSMSPGLAYVHSFVANEQNRAHGFGLDYGLAASIRIAGTARAGVDLAAGFRVQGVYADVRYVDDGSGDVVHRDDSILYLFPSAATIFHVSPAVTLALEAAWWLQYDVLDDYFWGMGAPLLSLGVEVVPPLRAK